MVCNRLYTRVGAFNQSFVFSKEPHTWDNSNLRTWTTSPHPQTLPLSIDLNLLLPYKMDILPYIWDDAISYLKIVNDIILFYMLRNELCYLRKMIVVVLSVCFKRQTPIIIIFDNQEIVNIIVRCT